MSPASRTSPFLGYFMLSLIWIVILAAVLLFARKPAPQPIEIVPPPTSPPTATPSSTATPSPIRVDVAGAVLSPGVYRLPPGSIVAEAIEAAGGPNGEADLDRINKAIALQDGVQVYVPCKVAEAPTPPLLSAPPAVSTSSGAVVAAGDKNVNINTASAEELDTLPGIGPVLAERIITGRPYTTVEDIMRVSGIGEALLEKLRGSIVVD